MMKRLYRSSTDKKIAGVAAGMAEYFNIDPTVSRVAWLIFILVTWFFPGLLLYIILVFLIPVEPQIIKDSEKVTADQTE